MSPTAHGGLGGLSVTKREKEGVAAEQPVEDQHARKVGPDEIKGARVSLSLGLVLMALGLGPWLLSYAGWLPAGWRKNQDVWLFAAGAGLALALAFYFVLRAQRLGTKLERNQAMVAAAVFIGPLVAFFVLSIGVFLWTFVTVVHGRLRGQVGPREYLFFLFMIMMMTMPVMIHAPAWIKTNVRSTAGIVITLIAFGIVLAAYVSSVLYCAWSINLDHPLPTILVVVFLLLAFPLWWAFIASARRLRHLLARRAEAE